MLARLDVQFGRQTLRTLSIQSPGRVRRMQVEVIDVNGGAQPVQAGHASTRGRLAVAFDPAAPVELNAGDTLAIRVF